MLVTMTSELGEEVSALDGNGFAMSVSTLDAVVTSGMALGGEVSALDESLLSSRVGSDSGDEGPVMLQVWC